MSENEDDLLRSRMIDAFEADLDDRVERAKKVKLQYFIPGHWFAAAASECAGMYISKYYYGCISVSQAYVEALSKFLTEHHGLKVGKDVERRWDKLCKKKLISSDTRDAALAIFDDRNDYHHLNKNVESDYLELQKRAEDCINHLHTIESDVFEYRFSKEEPGRTVLSKPEYWPPSGPDLVNVYIRQLW